MVRTFIFVVKRMRGPFSVIAILGGHLRVEQLYYFTVKSTKTDTEIQNRGENDHAFCTLER